MSSIKPVSGNVVKVKQKKTFLTALPGLFSEPIQINKFKKASRSEDKPKLSGMSGSSVAHKSHSSANVKRNIFADKEKNQKASDTLSTPPFKLHKSATTAIPKEKMKHQSSTKEEKPKLSLKKADHHHKKHEHLHKKKIDGEILQKKKNNVEHQHKKKPVEQKLPMNVNEAVVASTGQSCTSQSKNVDINTSEKGTRDTITSSETPDSVRHSSATKSPVYIYSAKGETNSVKVVFDEEKSDVDVNCNEIPAFKRSNSRHSDLGDNVFDNILSIDNDNSSNDEQATEVMDKCTSSTSPVASSTKDNILDLPSIDTQAIAQQDGRRTTISFTDEDAIVTEPQIASHNNFEKLDVTASPVINLNDSNVDEEHPSSAVLEIFPETFAQENQETNQTLNNGELEHKKLKRKHSDSSIFKHKHKKHKHDREHKGHSSHKHKHKHKKHKREKPEYSDISSEPKFHLPPKVELNPEIIIKTERDESSSVFIKKEDLTTDYFPNSPRQEKRRITDDLKIPKRGVLEFSYGQALSSDVDIANKFSFSSPEFRKYVHVETDPNGEASVLHAYQHEIAELSPDDQELFAKDFCTLCFQETNPSQADFVMGIVHGAASYMPDYLEYLSEEHPQLRVKTEVLGQRDILTMNVKEFRDQVCKTYSKESGMYRSVLFLHKLYQENKRYLQQLLLVTG